MKNDTLFKNDSKLFDKVYDIYKNYRSEHFDTFLRNNTQ